MSPPTRKSSPSTSADRDARAGTAEPSMATVTTDSGQLARRLERLRALDRRWSWLRTCRRPGRDHHSPTRSSGPSASRSGLGAAWRRCRRGRSSSSNGEWRCRSTSSRFGDCRTRSIQPAADQPGHGDDRSRQLGWHGRLPHRRRALGRYRIRDRPAPDGRPRRRAGAPRGARRPDPRRRLARDLQRTHVRLAAARDALSDVWPPSPAHAGRLDLLPIARGVWKHRLPDARLASVEAAVAGVERHEDVPGP